MLQATRSNARPIGSPIDVDAPIVFDAETFAGPTAELRSPLSAPETLDATPEQDVDPAAQSGASLNSAEASLDAIVDDALADEALIADASLNAPAQSYVPLTPDFNAGLRERVRQALVCPYCRDEVQRAGPRLGTSAVACAAKACSALYHQECWDELHADHGQCAVFGCDSNHAAPVSSAAYLWRVARLLLAASVLPRRVLDVLEEDGEGLGAQIARLSAGAFPSLDPTSNGPAKLAAYVFSSVLMAVATVPLLTALLPRELAPLAVLLAPLIVAAGAFVLPTLCALAIVTTVCSLRGLGLLLRKELEALGQRDAPPRPPATARPTKAPSSK